jgi:hypothetical protein
MSKIDTWRISKHISIRSNKLGYLLSFAHVMKVVDKIRSTPIMCTRSDT